ncbi:hypothetical protein [Bacillus paranthracis]|uniref:hypothetical protein n=2 Tax=Bacillus paranthracis TaxID=2026186 RepID=UPI000A764225|nr:hypothetical protein [Bacillus paranthracis]
MLDTLNRAILLLFLNSHAETKERMIQFEVINKSNANQYEQLNKETTSNSLRFKYNLQTNYFTNLIATTNKDSQHFNSQTKQQTKSIATKKDHKKKSNNKLFEYTHKGSYGCTVCHDSVRRAVMLVCWLIAAYNGRLLTSQRFAS